MSRCFNINASGDNWQVLSFMPSIQVNAGRGWTPGWWVRWWWWHGPGVPGVQGMVGCKAAGCQYCFPPGGGRQVTWMCHMWFCWLHLYLDQHKAGLNFFSPGHHFLPFPVLVQQIPESIHYPWTLHLLLGQGTLSMAEKVKAFRLKIAQRMVELKKQPSEMLFLVSLGEVVVGIVGTGL